MREQDKQLLLNYLCSSLPYGIMVQVTSKHPVILGDGNESDELDEPYDVLLTIDDHDSLVDFFNGDWVIDIKPYLRPMSSMTEEEKDRYNSFINHFEGDNLPNYESDFVYANESHELVDWLNENHFDYRGLIPMRLALPAPDGMYNF